MSDIQVKLVLNFGGELAVDSNGFPTYSGGKINIIRCPVSYGLDQLKARIHRAVGSTPDAYDLNLICKFPVRETYIAWRVEDDDGCNTLLEEARGGPITVYVEKEHLSSIVPTQVTACDSTLESQNIFAVSSGMSNLELLGSFTAQLEPSPTCWPMQSTYLPSSSNPIHDDTEAAQGLDDQPENLGYESMSSQEEHSSSDSSEEEAELEVQDDEVVAEQHAFVDGLIQKQVFGTGEWVSQMVTSNEFVQFARTSREWEAELALDDNELREVEPDFRIVTELYEGMIFKNKWDLQCTVAAWAILSNVEYKKKDSNKKKLTLVCIDHQHPTHPCPWRLHAVQSKK